MDAKKIIFLVTALMIIGCGKEKIVYVDKPVYVEVPIVQKVELEKPKKPIYYIANNTKNSSPSQIAENYVNTIKELNAYIERLEAMLEPFLKKE